MRRGDELREIELDLAFAFVPLALRAVPGTRVFAGPEEATFYVAEVGESGELELPERFLRGTYQLRAERDGYVPVTTRLSLDGEGVMWVPRQAPLPASLRILTTPAGAEVLFRERYLGETPVEITRLPPGEKLIFTLRKEGYRAEQAEKSLRPGESQEWKVPALVPTRGTLRIDLSWEGLPPENPGKARILLNGTPLAEGEGWDLIPVRAGRHEVEVRHPAYDPASATVEVRDRETVVTELALEPRPVRLFLRVESNNPVRFRLNGEPVEPNEDSMLSLPPARSNEVTVDVRDYLSVKRNFKGRPHERIVWEVPLRPLPGPEPGEGWRPPYLSLPMSWIPPGRFRMGSPVQENRRLPNEGSITFVRMDHGYWISQYEVTQEAWNRVMAKNPSRFEGNRHPVDSVTWRQARRFCAQLTRTEQEGGRLPAGYRYRLPTETEWEYAARAGTTTPFSFGVAATPGDGNFQGRFSPEKIEGLSPDGRYGTLPVGHFPPNAFGLHDVHGNVAEWTLDRYWDRHPGGQEVEPVNLSRGRGRTVRGGSWKDSADRVRSAARKGLPTGSKRNSLGFRVVLAPEIPALVPVENAEGP